MYDAFAPVSESEPSDTIPGRICSAEGSAGAQAVLDFQKQHRQPFSREHPGPRGGGAGANCCLYLE